MGGSPSKVAILVEDSYGRLFVRELLKKMGLMGSTYRCERFAGTCNTKSARQVRAAALDHDLVVILVDGDWDPGSVEERIRSHLRNLKEELREKIRIVVIDSEIEEWVCECLGINLGRGEKPSEALSRHYQRSRGFQYEKWRLPSLVEELSVEALQRLYVNNSSFRRFVNAIKL